jgi:hypothetical protein
MEGPVQAKNWNEAHAQLQQSMKREIETMREILANMHEEEMSLIRKDKHSWSLVMQKRTQLLAQLNDVRKVRLEATQKLESIAGDSLEKSLPATDENSCETLFLRDQMLALIDRLNLQNSCNEALFYIFNANLQPVPVPAKAKTSIATIPPKE